MVRAWLAQQLGTTPPRSTQDPPSKFPGAEFLRVIHINISIRAFQPIRPRDILMYNTASYPRSSWQSFLTLGKRMNGRTPNYGLIWSMTIKKGPCFSRGRGTHGHGSQARPVYYLITIAEDGGFLWFLCINEASRFQFLTIASAAV
ncbi:hypothetical protein QCA50_019138 [Cerrena zonata]|uniref:Uncharacterized protein n=1 Tax=Cerrena zonata TaxID=2478898 RepID=A0AAW0FBR7_9APHY